MEKMENLRTGTALQRMEMAIFVKLSKVQTFVSKIQMKRDFKI